MTDIDDALAAVAPTDHERAWAIVRDVELVVPTAVGDPRDPASGAFLQIESSGFTLIVAFTRAARIGGFRTRAKHHVRLTGAELAAAIPSGFAIVIDPGHDAGRVFLPDVLSASADEDVDA